MKHNGKGFPSCWFKPANMDNKKKRPLLICSKSPNKTQYKGFSLSVGLKWSQMWMTRRGCPPCPCNSRIRGAKRKKKAMGAPGTPTLLCRGDEHGSPTGKF